MKHFLHTLLLIAALFTQGCSPSATKRNSSDKIPVDFWVLWTGFEFEAMEEIVEQFNAAQHEIEVTALSVSDIRRKLLIATAGNDAPDLALLSDGIIPQFADRNALQPLDQYLPIIEVKQEQYSPVFLDICSYNDKLYGLPASSVAMALHWNKAAFQKAGLNPDQAPKSLQELDAWAKRLTQSDENEAYSSMGFLPTQPGWWPFFWAWCFGGGWLDAKGNPTANTPENIKAMEWVRSYSQQYGVRTLQNFTSNLGNFSSAQNGFFSGKNAMVLQGVWLGNFIQRYAPDLDWAAAPFPSAVGDSAGVCLVQCDAMVIPRNARHPKAAAQFIGFVQRPENLQALATAHGKFSPLLGMHMDPSQHPNQHIRLFEDLSQSPAARSVPHTPIWAEYSAELEQAFESIWLGSQTAEQALNTVQKRMDKKWAEYRRIHALIQKRKSS